MTKSKAKKLAWNAFARWVRNRGAKGAYNQCITCDRTYATSGRGVIQAGHFVPGRNNSILFDERNCFPQCYGCNVKKKGNMVRYYKWMLEHYGQEVIDELERASHQTVVFSVSDYLEIEQKYKDKLNQLTK
jgi:hypothetical protein